MGPQEWVFQESKQLGLIKFDFAEKGDPMSFAVNLASSMPRFSTPDEMQHLIRHSYVADEYDPDLLRRIGDVLADPRQCIVLLASKSLESQTLPLTQKWYKFNYSREKLTEERLAELSAASVPDIGKALDLPKPNNLIANNFDVLPEDSALSCEPQLVQTWEGLADLWYKKDDKFRKPKGIIACKIYTNDLDIGRSTEAKVFVEVWKRVLKEQLREFTYMADCASLSFTMVQKPGDGLEL